MAPAPVLLSYGQDNPTRRRVRRAVALAILALTAVLCYEPTVRAVQSIRTNLEARRDRSRYLNECLRYSARADQAVFDEAPLAAAAEQLTQVQPGTWVLDELARGITTEQRARRAAAAFAIDMREFPVFFTAFQGTDDILHGIVHCASCVRQFPLITISGNPPSSRLARTIFLHARRAANRPQRLVHVSFDGPAFAWFDHPVVAANVYSVGFWPSSLLCRSSSAHDLPLHRTREPLRLYAGQPDPNDESHFSIRYARDSDCGTIDGWLQPDDSVRFRLRPEAAAKSAR